MSPLDAIAGARHADPFSVLGPHIDDGLLTIRAYLPAAKSISVVRDGAEPLEMTRRHAAGVFEASVDGVTAIPDYRLRVSYPGGHTVDVDDPYRYGRIIDDYDLYLFGEGSHTRIYDKLGAHPMTVGTAAGVHFAVWAPNALRVERRRRLQLVGRARPPDAAAGLERRVGDLRARREAGRSIQVRDAHAHRRDRHQDGSVRAGVRGTAEVGVHRDDRRVRVAGRRVDAPASGGRLVVPAPDGHLRGAPRIVGARCGGRRPVSHVSRARAAADSLREGDGLHARRAPAGDGAPVFRVVGIPGDRLLRADEPVRHAGRLQGVRRCLPSARHRRDPRLGPGPLSQGRVRPRAIRRHRALRARGSAAGRAPRLGNADLQLRAQRGPKFPDRERAVLAARVPRRRAARGRGRVDAVPGLLAQSRRVDPEPLRRAREPRGDRLPAAAERADARRGAGIDHDCRGVHGLALGEPADVARRPGVHLQVEHGLDERHPAIREGGSRLSQVGSSPPHVLDALRVQRELHPSVLARRGRARQAIDVRQDSGRRLAEGGDAARAVRLHVRAPGQEADVHGGRDSARGTSGITTTASTGTCSRNRCTPAFSASCAT